MEEFFVLFCVLCPPITLGLACRELNPEREIYCRAREANHRTAIVLLSHIVFLDLKNQPYLIFTCVMEQVLKKCHIKYFQIAK